MTCEMFRERLPLMLYGELTMDEEEQLEQHAAMCGECTEERELLARVLQTAGLEREELPAGLLAKCRRDLGAAVAVEAAAAKKRGWWEGLGEWLRVDAAWLKPAGAVALLAMGFLGGRVVGPAAPGDSTVTTQPGSVARVRYVDTGIPGRVRLVVDETRQQELNGEIDDVRIRALLLGALTDQTDPGLRAETADVLRASSGHAEVRQALVNALRTDPNSGVRLKALEGLRRFANEAETRAALCEVLLSDENPAIRAQAIDLLVQHKHADVAGVLQEVLRKEDNSYVRSRSLKALSEMKASAGTF